MRRVRQSFGTSQLPSGTPNNFNVNPSMLTEDVADSVSAGYESQDRLSLVAMSEAADLPPGAFLDKLLYGVGTCGMQFPSNLTRIQQRPARHHRGHQVQAKLDVQHRISSNNEDLDESFLQRAQIHQQRMGQGLAASHGHPSNNASQPDQSVVTISISDTGECPCVKGVGRPRCRYSRAIVRPLRGTINTTREHRVDITLVGLKGSTTVLG